MNLSLVNITTAAVFQLLALCSQSAFTMGVGLKGTLPNINSNGHNEEQKIHRELPSNKIRQDSLVALVQDIDGPGKGGIYEVFGTASLSFKNLLPEAPPEGPNVFSLKITVSGKIAEDLGGLTGGAFLSPKSCGSDAQKTDVDAGSFSKWHLIGNTTVGGISQSASSFDFGMTSDDMVGKSVYLTSDGDEVIACGLFEKQTKGVALSTELREYPGYSGDLKVGGKVTVVFGQDGTFSLRYRMNGLESECQECGIHIHAGVSCEDKDGPQGHGWNSKVTDDMWTNTGGALYSSSKKGKSSGKFPMYTGFGKYETVNHAVVIHAQDGTRTACGTLSWKR